MRSSQILGKARHNLVPNRATVKDIYAHIRVPQEVRDRLPNAATNPYRKRPVAVTYDHDEFYTYLMPSERAFLYEEMDVEDLFGARKNRKYSPQMNFHQNLDTWMFCGMIGFSFLLLLGSCYYTDKHLALRESLGFIDMGKFDLQDFK